MYINKKQKYLNVFINILYKKCFQVFPLPIVYPNNTNIVKKNEY